MEITGLDEFLGKEKPHEDQVSKCHVSGDVIIPLRSFQSEHCASLKNGCTGL